MFRFIVGILISLAISAEAQKTNICMISATISASKPLYVYGEPIELVVTFANVGSESSAIAVNYPDFRDVGLSGITLSSERGRLTPRTRSVDNTELDRKVMVKKIDAGDKWSTKIYLQAYFQSPSPGIYKINYGVEVPCLAPDGSQQGIVNSQGSFSITVGPPNKVALSAIVDGFGRQVESTDFWTQRTATQALTAVDDPIVIPQLTKLIKLGSSEQAFDALTKFKGNTKAEAIVTGAIRSKKISHQLLALNVLSKWMAEVDEADLTPLLASPEPQVRIKTLQYVATIANPKHLSLITGMVDDSDPRVAEAAKKTKQVLEEKIK